jgi:FKBP-type peptidyl-prolyl cis-trans isomerase
MNKFFAVLAVGALLTLGACLDSDVSSSQEQFNADIASIDQYLTNHSIVAFKDISGVRFTIDSLGGGFAPRYSSKVTFSYTGKLLSGSIFQSSTLTNADISGLIIGMQIGLPLIPNGSKATLYIPSAYGYGSQTNGNIPANSPLIFQINLKNILVTSAEANQLGEDTVKIDNFLAAQNPAVIAVRDTSGLRYVITQEGTGNSPTWYDKVKISYIGYLINGNIKGEKFFEGANEPNSTNDSRVINYIRGFQMGLQKMKKGGKATLYIPSGMAFGTSSVTGLVPVPANSNVIYEVELIDIMVP